MLVAVLSRGQHIKPCSHLPQGRSLWLLNMPNKRKPEKIAERNARRQDKFMRYVVERLVGAQLGVDDTPLDFTEEAAHRALARLRNVTDIGTSSSAGQAATIADSVAKIAGSVASGSADTAAGAFDSASVSAASSHLSIPEWDSWGHCSDPAGGYGK